MITPVEMAAYPTAKANNDHSLSDEETETIDSMERVEMEALAQEQDVKDECVSAVGSGDGHAQEHFSKEDELERELDDASSKKLTKEEIDEKYRTLFEPKDGFVDLIGNGQLKKKVVKAGKPGTRPQTGNMIRAKVKVLLENGTCVHDAVETFFMSEGDTILAVDMCVAMMDVGEVAEIKAAPRFGYGTIGRDPDIPGDANLTVEMELLEVHPAPELSTMTLEKLLEFGEKKRVRGNELFTRGEYSGAIGAYLGALKFFEPKDRGVTGKQSDQIEDARLKTYNNMAASQLKIGASDAAIYSCRQVLSHQHDNIKALYRMGKAHCAKGEMEAAIQYLKEAIRLEPESKLLHRELSAWTKKMKKEMDSEKKMYRKMLGNTADPVSKDRRKSCSSSNMLKTSVIVGTIMVAIFSVGFAYFRTTH